MMVGLSMCVCVSLLFDAASGAIAMAVSYIQYDDIPPCIQQEHNEIATDHRSAATHQYRKCVCVLFLSLTPCTV